MENRMNRTAALLLLFPITAFAQLPVWTDAFADGEFLTAPPWTGDTASFEVVDGQLRSAGPAASSNLGLFTALPPGTAGGQREWRAVLDLDFDPSSSNYVRLWLAAEHTDADAPGDGYVLQVGEASATRSDSLDFFRSDEGTLVKLWTSPVPVISSTSFNRIALRVLRDSLGGWRFAAASGEDGTWDPDLTQPDYVDLGGVADAVYAPDGWTGWQCRYSSASRADGYGLDAVYAGPPVLDRAPPQWTGLEVPEDDHLLLRFSEALDSAAAVDATHYRLSGPGIGGTGGSSSLPAEAVWLADDPTRVDLWFADPFPPAVPLQLRVQGLRDPAGNSMPPDSLGFTWYLPGTGDLVISEIMADETPAAFLPEAEYLELTNRAPVALDLAGMRLMDATAEALLPAVSVPAGGFALLTDPDDTAVFAPLLPPDVVLLGLDGMPSLNNSGDELRLLAADGTLLDAVSYTDAWYQDPAAEDGGWALERIDLGRPWLGACNWRASGDPMQGSPGRANTAVFSDTMPPKLASAVPVHDTLLRLVFDREMDSVSMLKVGAYALRTEAGSGSGGTGTGDAVGIGAPSPEAVGGAFTAVLLPLDRPLEPGRRYWASVRPLASGPDPGAGPRSCAGRPARDSLHTGWPELPDSADLVLNELLFDPVSGGTDYVELINRSAKTIDLRQAFLVEGDVDAGLPPGEAPALDVAPLAPSGYLLFPGEVLAFSADAERTRLDYPYGAVPERILEVSDLPSWPDADQSGIVRLEYRRNDTLMVLDAVHYTTAWHHALLGDAEGVSLERLDPDQSAADPANWHSAPGRVGYGTPGAPNAMAWTDGAGPGFAGGGKQPGQLLVEPELFTPDGDGIDDLVRIHYRFEGPGWVAHTMLYTAAGIPIQLLANNRMLPAEGHWVWDGTTSEGRAAPLGAYIVHAECWHPDGAVLSLKKRIVLGP